MSICKFCDVIFLFLLINKLAIFLIDKLANFLKKNFKNFISAKNSNLISLYVKQRRNKSGSTYRRRARN